MELTKEQEAKLTILLLMMRIEKNPQDLDPLPNQKEVFELLSKDLPQMINECLGFFGIDASKGMHSISASGLDILRSIDKELL